MTQASPPQEIRHDTLDRVTGRSGRGTARQTMRIPEDLWVQFEVAAKRAGAKDRSEVVRDFIRWYVRETGAKMPRRPAGHDADQAE